MLNLARSCPAVHIWVAGAGVHCLSKCKENGEIHGLLEIYSQEFMAWTVSFVGWDLYNYKGQAKEELIQRVCKFWENYNLHNYTKLLSSKDKVYYTYMRKCFVKHK